MKYFAGWGTLLEQCFDELCERIGGLPDFICDNAPEKQGRSLHGIPCISLDQTKNDPHAEFFITVRRHRELAEQIRQLGHRHIRIAHFDRGYHKFVFLGPYPAIALPAAPYPKDFFRGKHVLITGASRGLGSCLARTLAAQGANLLLHARDTAHLADMHARCRDLGGNVKLLAADLEQPQAIDSLIREAMGAVPAIDVLYNNAGYAPPLADTPYRIPPQDFERCFRINALAPILLASACIPGMLSRGFGRIVNVSTALQYEPRNSAYATSKAALDKFVADLAPTLDDTGVAISLVDPGSLQTDMNPSGLYSAASAVNGLLIAALHAKCNGRWISAQDYARLSLDEAHAEALHRHRFACS